MWPATGRNVTLAFWPLKMVLIGCPETSVTTYQSTTRKVRGERRFNRKIYSLHFRKSRTMYRLYHRNRPCWLFWRLTCTSDICTQYLHIYHSYIIYTTDMRKSHNCTCFMRRELQDQYCRTHLIPCFVNTFSFYSRALGDQARQTRNWSRMRKKKKFLMEHCLLNFRGVKNFGCHFSLGDQNIDVGAWYWWLHGIEYFTILAPRILRCFLQFWKICGRPSVSC